MSAGTLGVREVLGRGAVHPFPARMAPSVALDALAKVGRGATVVDPMVGSGTVLAIARARGHRCIGFDVDPLAVLISRVWTRSIYADELREEAAAVLSAAKKIAVGMLGRDSYPETADDETRAFVKYWFDGRARRQLKALSVALASIKANAVREALWCAFSRQIITKQSGVSLALDLAHSRPHKVFESAPQRPFELFLSCVERVIAGCPKRGVAGVGPVARIELGDVRDMPLAAGSVDLVFTSPPYLNAIDYLRCSKFSLVWMGYSISKLREVRSSSIGAEVAARGPNRHEAVWSQLSLKPALAPRMTRILQRYIDDTARAMSEVARVLAPSGKAVYVVGENTIRGTYIPTADIVRLMAEENELQLDQHVSRDLPNSRRYLPPPGNNRSAMDSRMRREVILTFGKRE